jgi:geranylgeranyl transferase type-1 subunit beta
MERPAELPLSLAPHVKYALAVLSSAAPASAAAADSMRVTVVYFALHTLDLCGALPALPPSRRQEVEAWLLSCLCADGGCAGGARAPGLHSHVACTYAAVCGLVILGADLAPLPLPALRATLRALQAPCGGLASSAACPAEVDLRFLYSALALCRLLELPLDWGQGGGGGEGRGALHAPSALRYIAACQTHEGGFALHASGGGEAHGASTYCALAAWALLLADGGGAQRLPAGAPRLDLRALRRWLELRASAGCGVSGRAGKAGDACYTWWVGASLRVLGALEAPAPAPPALAQAPLLAWLAQCRGSGGLGFGKDPEEEADPFHTVFALAGLALGEGGGGGSSSSSSGRSAGAGAALAPVVATLGVTRRALAALRARQLEGIELV